ncbi:MAG: sigma-70 family RNA polymerase sigma factor [Cyclobacteriaceae bacterium]|nr:sigma-70 family RNA polymerase sigma factor [Cyclobacteriaceae bacterium]MCH8516867.1 sigma-70 family RNA polymerase sigma factor [Cyclobacteriaceae bacterium]
MVEKDLSIILIEEVRRGNDTAFNQLLSIWYPKLYNYAFKYFGESNRATEVSQQAAVSIYQHIHQLSNIEKMKPWFYSIIANQCRQESRRLKREGWISFDQLNGNSDKSGDGNWEISTALLTNPEDHYRQQELKAVLLKCMAQLKPEQREVLIMKEYEGLKFREIADTLNISESTAKTRLYAALGRIKQLLEIEGIDSKWMNYEKG